MWPASISDWRRSVKSIRNSIPIGSVNPALPDWKEDLRRCVETHKMPGVRLHPNYHGYTLDDPRFAELLELAARRGGSCKSPPSWRTPARNTRSSKCPMSISSPLPGVMNRIQKAKVQILNDRPRSPLLSQLAKTPGLYFDTARVEGTDGIPNSGEEPAPRPGAVRNACAVSDSRSRPDPRPRILAARRNRAQSRSVDKCRTIALISRRGTARRVVRPVLRNYGPNGNLKC